MKPIFFKSTFNQSQSDAGRLPIERALKLLLPGFRRTIRPSPREDRKGADTKAIVGKRKVHIDYKIRSKDPRTWGEDDLAIELYSVVEKRIRGYQNKSTDFLLWIFKDTGRYVLVPFQPFLELYKTHWKEWEFWLTEPRQTTRLGLTTYSSSFAMVPFNIFETIATEVILEQ